MSLNSRFQCDSTKTFENIYKWFASIADGKYITFIREMSAFIRHLGVIKLILIWLINSRLVTNSFRKAVGKTIICCSRNRWNNYRPIYAHFYHCRLILILVQITLHLFLFFKTRKRWSKLKLKNGETEIKVLSILIMYKTDSINLLSANLDLFWHWKRVNWKKFQIKNEGNRRFW